MTAPKFEKIQQRVYTEGNLVLPDKVRNAILSCLQTDPASIQTAKNYLASVFKGDYISQPDVVYESESTIDAYTLDYLPRNFFVPRIAIRDLALSSETFKFGDTIRVLDIGSGTGAVALGVLELFSTGPLSKYKIHFQAIDESEKALLRQKALLKAAGFSFEGDNFSAKKMDLSDTNAVDKLLSTANKWDIIISANFMVELNPTAQTNLLTVLSKHLSDDGSIIIAEPCQDRGKILLHKFAPLLSEIGLSVYYPCSEITACDYYVEKDRSAYDKCWVWRDYEFTQVAPLVTDKKIITFSGRPLCISLITFNKKNVSILSPFIKKRPDLKWGFVRKRGKGNDYEICPGHHRFSSIKSYKNGSIVGWQTSGYQINIEEYVEL